MRPNWKFPVSLAACLLAAAPHAQALAQTAKVGDRITFVTCPLVRDTFVPAWLAQYEGEL